jgi:RNA polymerase sigma factor (sigma-70 family)
MDERNILAAQFEAHRPHLRGVAYRMLGSLSEAEDAVQEAWFRLNNTDAAGIDNLGGWLTTVVGRVSLDMLRARKARREEALGEKPPEPAATAAPGGPVDPEQEAALADSVGVALLVMLDALAPAERLAFVLHDLFGVSFDEIGAIVNRTPEAARQLASRARRRVQGAGTSSTVEVTQQRRVVDSFLSALRRGDIDALLDVLDPDLVVRADAAASQSGKATEVRGAKNWAKGAVKFSRMLPGAQPALINGEVGIVLAVGGRLFRVLRFTLGDGRIRQIDVVAEPAALAALELGVMPSP